MTRKIGMFGGTFNPPHIGHVHAACAASEALGLEVLFVPDNIPPHKELPRGSASAQDRFAMTQIAARSVPGAGVSDMELRRGERSYTADTLEELYSLYPDAMLWLIVGTDMLCTLEHWYRPDRILTLCRVAALARSEGDHALIQKYAARLTARFGADIDVVDTDPVPISSSQIREGLYHGTEKWLPAGVFAYIKEKGLYLET